MRPACRALPGFLLLCLLAGGVRAAAPDDEAQLRRLNDDCVGALVGSDVAWFRTRLDDDFTAVLSNGSSVGKAEFLRQVALPLPVKDFQEQGVEVRLYCDTALVSALATGRTAKGILARSRYTYVYIRRGGAWQIVSIQVTRISP